MTFAQWFEQYHNAYCVDVIAYDKQRDYYYINKKHFHPIADMELQDIKPIDIQSCMKTTAGYSSDRQRSAYFLLKKVFDEAIANGYADINPVSRIKAPKRIKTYAECFDPTAISSLFDCDTKLSRMFEFDLWTGLRRGELLALTWENINIEQKLIYVRQSIIKTKGGDIIQHTTKSRRDRVVPLSDRALDILRRIFQNDTQSGFVFTSSDGDFISLRNYNRLYKKFFEERQKACPDLQYLSPHKLRHTYATFMLHSGADLETLRALLGHVDISTTQRYVHSNMSQMRLATQKLTFSYSI